MRSLALIHGSVAIACSLLAPLVVAADKPDLSFLLFDPVPLVIAEPAADTQTESPTTSALPADKPPYVSKELLPVPSVNARPLQALLGVAVTPIASDAEGQIDTTLAADIARYETSLKELEQATGGAYSMVLPETLMGLGAAYERAGDFPKALTLYERASHIIRVNNGLFSLEQEDVIMRMINNHLARGDVVAADEQQQYLYYLRRKAYPVDSPLLVNAMQDFARWNLQAFNYYFGAQPMTATVNTASTATGEVATAAPVTAVDDTGEFALRHLFNAQVIYQQISNLLLDRFGNTDPRLPDNEKQLAVTNYLFATNVIIRGGGSLDGVTSGFAGPEISMRRLGYGEGRSSMERRVDYLSKTPGTSAAVLAQARLELVDWMISTHSRSDIQSTFQRAYEDFAASGATPEQVAAMFHPVLPVQLPSVVPLYYTRESFGIPPDVALEYRGFIDMEFGISKIGDSMSPKLLYRTPDTPDDVVEVLTRLIRRAQFRPRLIDGQLIADDRVTLRYYYTY